MGEAKHTPEPWEVHTRSVPWRGNPELGTREVVYIINRHTDTHVFGDDVALHPDARHAANARLIAAAPELLEAGREMADAFNDGLCNDQAPDFDKDRIHRAYEALRAAISKATGERA